MTQIPPHLRDDGLSLADFMPGGATKVEAGYQAVRGQALTPGQSRASEQPLVEAIQTVHDPEIPVNLWDLGLIYRLEQLPNGDVEVDMTLTAPGCPVAGEMPVMVADAPDAAAATPEVGLEMVIEAESSSPPEMAIVPASPSEKADVVVNARSNELVPSLRVTV